MKITLTILTLLFVILNAHSQLHINKYNLTIKTELSDTLQQIYGDFINNEVAKISIVGINKSYSHPDYYNFLKNKRFYQSRQKWIRNNSYQESIIREGDPYLLVHFDSIVFDSEFRGIDNEFITSEVILDSTETKLALKEMFNGAQNYIVTMCYNPRHAVLFYNSEDKVIGIYEICFECSNVNFGIIGTRMSARNSPYLKSLFSKYEKELK